MSPQEAARLVGHELGERRPAPAPTPDRRVWIAPGMAVAAALCAVMAWAVDARGAERRYELVLFEKPQATEPQDRQRIWVLAQYPTKDDCVAVLHSVKIRAPGAKAKCLPKED